MPDFTPFLPDCDLAHDGLVARATGLTSFPLTYLTPAVTFEGQTYLSMTPQLTGMARADLGPQAGSLPNQQRVIFTAIDFRVRGF
jgi:CcdB protein